MVRLAKVVKCTYISKCFFCAYIGAAHELFRKIYKNRQCIHDRIFWMVAVRDDFQHHALYLWSHLVCHPSIIGSQNCLLYRQAARRDWSVLCAKRLCRSHANWYKFTIQCLQEPADFTFCCLKLICGSSCCVPAIAWSILEQPWREGCVWVSFLGHTSVWC